MLNDWELWACANQVVKTHGENAPLHVAEQIGGHRHLAGHRQTRGGADGQGWPDAAAISQNCLNRVSMLGSPSAKDRLEKE